MIKNENSQNVLQARAQETHLISNVPSYSTTRNGKGAFGCSSSGACIEQVSETGSAIGTRSVQLTYSFESAWRNAC